VRAAETQAAGGNLTGARELLAEAVDRCSATLGPDHLDVLAAQARLAGLHRELGSLHEARRLLESVLETGHRAHGVAHPQLLLVSYELAVLAHELGNAYEAGKNFRLLGKWGPEVLGADHPHVLVARRYLGEDVPGDVPGDIDAPPPLPLPPVGPPPGESILDGPAPERRNRFPLTAAIAGMALFAVVATVVAVWAIPERDTRSTPPPQAGPVAPAGTPSVGASPSAIPSSSPSASEPAITVPGVGEVRTSPTRTVSSRPPQTLAGRYLIHAGHTGMCLGLGPELFRNTGRTVMGQHPCGSGLPQLSLEPVTATSYRLLVTDAGGTGCADVDYAGTTEGLLLAPQTCNDKADQRFTFEPVTSPVPGYRLRSLAGSRYCIGVLEGRRQSGVQIMQDTCRGGAHEVFTLERR
jgi:hypothetical protein